MDNMRHTSKCKNRRVFNIGICEAPIEGLRALRNMPLKLKEVVYLYEEVTDRIPSIEALRDLPQITMIHVCSPNLDDAHEDFTLQYIKD